MVKDKIKNLVSNKTFIKRTISGLMLLLILFFLLNIGGPLLLISCMAVSIIGIFEILRIFNLERTSIAWTSYISTVIYYIIIYINKSYVLHFTIIFLILILIFYLLKYPKFHIKDVAICYFSVIYVGVLFSFIYLIRELSFGKYIVWLVFIASWGSDTCAYLTGMIVGKHKITPKLSPHKTIEGSIGGIIGSALLGNIYLIILSNALHIYQPLQFVTMSIICILGSILSQFGDLAASGLKRDTNIKDFGTLIPGHGGVLDRFDSVLFTSVAIYFTILFINKYI